MTESATPAKKTVQVHATIDRELHDSLVEYRWANRLEMVDVFKLALSEFAARNGLKVAAAPAAEKAAPKA